MDVSEAWRSLLCSYEFNSDNQLSAVTDGRLRQQHAHPQPDVTCKRHCNRHGHRHRQRMTRQTPYPTHHNPPPTLSIQRHTYYTKETGQKTVTSMSKGTGTSCCATGGYNYYVYGTSLYNTNRGSTVDKQTNPSQREYMEDAQKPECDVQRVAGRE